MKGLLIKDFYAVVTQLKIFIILIIVSALIPGYPMGAFTMVYVALLPINALAWDEQSKWDNLARMMPYSKFDLVFSKYIIGYISILSAAVLCTGFAFVYSFFPSSEPLNISSVVMFACSGAGGLLLMALNLPLMFRLGVEKGRLLFGIMVGVSCVLIAVANGIIGDGKELFTQIPPSGIIAAVIAALVLINAVSVMLSMKWYGKRE